MFRYDTVKWKTVFNLTCVFKVSQFTLLFRDSGNLWNIENTLKTNAPVNTIQIPAVVHNLSQAMQTGPDIGLSQLVVPRC